MKKTIGLMFGFGIIFAAGTIGGLELNTLTLAEAGQRLAVAGALVMPGFVWALRNREV